MAAPVVAVVGGGQLARMMVPAATALGVHLRVLVEDADSSAAQVVVDAPVGAAGDPAAVERLVDGAAVLTFEHEHVPGALLTELRDRGVAVHPGPAALVHAQDKIVMRTRLAGLAVPCPRWAALDTPAELDRFLAEGDGIAVVKTARGGYDGKGVRVVRSSAEAADWFTASADGTGVPLLAEEKVPFTRELAVLVARTPSGEVRTWPVVESVQRDGVCFEVTAPAPGLDPATAAEAERIGRSIAEGLDVTGVLAVELFEVPDPADPAGAPRVLVNELAMRPHNSGHWTIDGSMTSQFEQHLRAVLDLPLGDTAPRAPWTVMVNVLGSTRDTLADGLAALDPGARPQLYGKAVRPGRKLGHVTVYGDDLTTVRERARAAAAVLRGDRD